MQIVVPMSGFGERFRRAGYDVPKPLIEVEGKPIIAHVIDLFPGETRFVFVCSQTHLDEPRYRMRELLARYCPSGIVRGIASHSLGPVHAVLSAVELLVPEEPVIVNYCDFACVWDYRDFSDFVARTGCDGAIPSYTGFHPHMLGSTSYAYLQLEKGRVRAVREKQPFTSQPTSELASTGTYYFRSAALMRDALERAQRRDDTLTSGERYVSLAYRPLLDDGRYVAAYEVDHFMQWGTPEDLREYRYWSSAFRLLADPERPPTPLQRGVVMVPMAGQGARFRREGYAEPKPLIPVSGLPMVVQATRDLPSPDEHVFIAQRELLEASPLRSRIAQHLPRARYVALDGPTEGQALTCLLGMKGIDPTLPLTIGACDSGALYDAAAFARLLASPDVDVVVFTARGFPGAARAPSHYGWVDEEDGRVRRVSVKQALTDPTRDPVVIGTFTFKRASDFVRAAQTLIARDGRVNGELYVDSCINDAITLGLRCRTLDVSHYLCWGTPDELRTFAYWQAAFHRWPTHPYVLEGDVRVPRDALAALDAHARRGAVNPRPR